MGEKVIKLTASFLIDLTYTILFWWIECKIWNVLWSFSVTFAGSRSGVYKHFKLESKFQVNQSLLFERIIG